MTSIDIIRRAANSIVFTAGTTIFREGTPGDAMYVVADGLVDLMVHGSRVATVGAGSVIGEMAPISKRPRSASAIARTDCTLAPIDDHQYRLLVKQTMEMLVDRLRQSAPIEHDQPTARRS